MAARAAANNAADMFNDDVMMGKEVLSDPFLISHIRSEGFLLEPLQVILMTRKT